MRASAPEREGDEMVRQKVTDAKQGQAAVAKPETKAPGNGGRAKNPPARGAKDPQAHIDKQRKQALDLALSQIHKRCGNGSIMYLGSDARAEGISTISTGSISTASSRAARAFLNAFGVNSVS